MTKQAGLGQRLHETTDQIFEIKTQLVRNFGYHAESLVALIKQRPLLALALGLGGGYVIARMVRR
jgi:hypothetical protein